MRSHHDLIAMHLPNVKLLWLPRVRRKDTRAALAQDAPARGPKAIEDAFVGDPLQHVQSVARRHNLYARGGTQP